MTKIKVAPSILSCDFAHLADEIKLVEDAGADYIHLDVMDGHFVPNLTMGPVVIKSIKSHTHLPLDAHLMIENVSDYIKIFAEAGADIITFHIEAVKNSVEIISLIRHFGKKVGVSIKPNTPADTLIRIIDLVDLVLVMTVEPGFSGQQFMESQLEKIKTIKNMIDHSKNKTIELEVDGGINDRTAKQAIKAGASVLVSGAYIFSIDKNYSSRIASLKNNN